MDHLKETCAAARNLLKQMPKADLGFFPTPLYKLDHLSEELGVNLYIKRDDFTGMNLFGGNKIRKLQYLIGMLPQRDVNMCLPLERPSPTTPCRPFPPAAAAD